MAKPEAVKAESTMTIVDNGTTRKVGLTEAITVLTAALGKHEQHIEQLQQVRKIKDAELDELDTEIEIAEQYVASCRAALMRCQK